MWLQEKGKRDTIEEEWRNLRNAMIEAADVVVRGNQIENYED